MSSEQAGRDVADALRAVRSLVRTAVPQTVMGVVLPGEVRRVTDVLREISLGLGKLEQSLVGSAPPRTLDEYRVEIDRFNSGQPNAQLLNDIRAFNHGTIDALNRIQPLAGQALLDIGASPHGYALERALALGAASYVGIGLDVTEPIVVQGPAGYGELKRQDAEALNFADASFDVIVSMSTFEHVAHVDRVLNEIHRVLRPGGRALVTFEPIWTCSYGHHLHHFGAVASCMPDWAQLVWTRPQMEAELANIWPHDDPTLSLHDAAAWVYDGPVINRVGIRQMRDYFERSPLTVEWTIPLMDSGRDPERVAFVSRTVDLTAEELMTKGLSVLLSRV